uniref:Uncharacterized protein n=1 Tax=Panagrolaimus davidi TaxID=227884 RepID=A0A914P7Y9_9BILA
MDANSPSAITNNGSGSGYSGALGIATTLPATSYRFKLPPLQVSHSTLISTNRAPDFGINELPLSKPMTSVGEPMRNKADSF